MPRKDNMTEEDTSLSREDIQKFLTEGKSKNKKKAEIEADLRAHLKGKGHKDEAAEKVIGDLDSYL